MALWVGKDCCVKLPVIGNYTLVNNDRASGRINGGGVSKGADEGGGGPGGGTRSRDNRRDVGTFVTLDMVLDALQSAYSAVTNTMYGGNSQRSRNATSTMPEEGTADFQRAYSAVANAMFGGNTQRSKMNMTQDTTNAHEFRVTLPSGATVSVTVTGVCTVTAFDVLRQVVFEHAPKNCSVHEFCLTHNGARLKSDAAIVGACDTTFALACRGLHGGMDTPQTGSVIEQDWSSCMPDDDAGADSDAEHPPRLSRGMLTKLYHIARVKFEAAQTEAEREAELDNMGVLLTAVIEAVEEADVGDRGGDVDETEEKDNEDEAFNAAKAAIDPNDSVDQELQDRVMDHMRLLDRNNILAVAMRLCLRNTRIRAGGMRCAQTHELVFSLLRQSKPDQGEDPLDSILSSTQYGSGDTAMLREKAATTYKEIVRLLCDGTEEGTPDHDLLSKVVARMDCR
jgi:hypothetical protein